jgi:hypothetical protein
MSGINESFPDGGCFEDSVETRSPCPAWAAYSRGGDALAILTWDIRDIGLHEGHRAGALARGVIEKPAWVRVSLLLNDLLSICR